MEVAKPMLYIVSREYNNSADIEVEGKWPLNKANQINIETFRSIVQVYFTQSGRNRSSSFSVVIGGTGGREKLIYIYIQTM